MRKDEKIAALEINTTEAHLDSANSVKFVRAKDKGNKVCICD